ncbi:TPA: ParB N-terminal domain-containing protein [Legionella pneumophila]
MSMIFENSTIERTETIIKKPSSSNGDVTRSLNFGNVSKQVSFNDGNDEGYYKVRPKALKPSTHNPRPDWVIDDAWLVKHVGIDMEDIFESNMNLNCLVKINEEEIDGKLIESIIFPQFEELLNSPNITQKKEYDFLVNLAKSIKETGQIQPIEIESDSENNTLVVLEGHLRRLACILGRIPYIKAIRNEGLHNLSRRDKIGRQITENSLRTNISVLGNFKLASEEIKENPKITVRDLSARLKIQKDLASTLIKLILYPDKYHSSIYSALESGHLSANNLIKAASYNRQDRQELFIYKLLEKNIELPVQMKKPIPRGTDGRKKSVASMQIKTIDNCVKAGNKLLSCIPELKDYSTISEVKTVDDMVSLLKSLEEFLLGKSTEEK